MAKQVGKELGQQIDSQFVKDYRQQLLDQLSPYKSAPKDVDMGYLMPQKSNEDLTKYHRLLGTTFDPSGNLYEQAAQAQSVGERLAKTLPRIGLKVLEETAKLPGELYGLGEWALTDKTFGEAVNNAWVQGVTEKADWIRENGLEVYVPNSVKNGNLWDNITSSSFWATEGADGVGFLLSMLLPGQFLKAAKFGKLPAAGVGAFNDMAKVATKGTKAETLTAKLFSKGSIGAERFAGKIDDFGAATVNTAFESASEGIEASQGVKDKFIQQKYQQLVEAGVNSEEAQQLAEQYGESDEVKEAAGKAGHDVFMRNLAILIGPNILDQKWLFNGFKSAKAAEGVVNKRLGKAVAEGGENFLENVTRLSSKDKFIKGLEKTAIGVGKEGFFEEGLQFAASESAQNYAVNPDKAENLLETYFDNLSNTDMQKSIFLGAVMGGVMGGIGGVNAANREDEYLFGKKGREYGGIAKYLGLRDVQESRGVVDILKSGYIARYKTVADLFQRDDQGKIIFETNEKNELVLDDKGQAKPLLDKNKVLKFGQDIIKDQVNKEKLQDYVEKDSRDGYEFIKAQMDLNYMMPWIREEGGYEMLKQHINTLSESDLQQMQETGLFDQETDIQEVKQDLLDKAEKAKKAYDNAERNAAVLISPKNKEEKEQFNFFKEQIFDAYIGAQYMRDVIDKRTSQIKSEISKTPLGNTRVEKPTGNLKAGSTIQVDGETKVVMSSKEGIVKLRDLNGVAEETTIDELKSKDYQMIRGLWALDRTNLAKNVESLGYFQEELQRLEDDQEKLSTKKGQQEGFNKMVKDTQERIKRGEKAAKEKVKDEVKKETNPKNINKKINETESEKEKNNLKEIVKQQSKQERSDDYVPPPPPPEGQEGFIPQEEGEESVMPENEKPAPDDVDVNTLVGEADKYYANKPNSLVVDMNELLGDVNSKNQDKNDGKISKALDEKDLLGSVFEAWKREEYNPSLEKEQVFIGFMNKALANEFSDIPEENEIIRQVLTDYFNEINQENKLAQETKVPEDYDFDPEPMDPENKPSITQSEQESNQDLDTREEGTGDIVLVSHDHVFKRKDKFDQDKEQAWLHQRDKDGNPVPFTGEGVFEDEFGNKVSLYIDKALHKELTEGRKLISEGKIPVGTKLKFKIDPSAPYNINKRGKTRRGEDIQIQVIVEYQGKDYLVGFVPIHYKDLNENTKNFRSEIYKEYSERKDKEGIFTSKLTSEVTKIKSGKVLLYPTYRSVKESSNIGEFYLTAVVPINGHNTFYTGEENNIPEGMLDQRNPEGKEPGSIFIWVKHKASGRWHPIRAFAQKLMYLPKLKQTVKDKLKEGLATAETKDQIKAIKDSIRKSDAVIEFRLEDGIIIPYEKSGGKWIRKDGTNGTYDLRFPLAEIDTHENVDRWLNGATSQINKNLLNVGKYNTNIADRILTNTGNGDIFSDVNFEFAPPSIKEKPNVNEEVKQQAVDETIEEEEKKIVTPPIDPEVKSDEKIEEELDLGEELGLDEDLEIDLDEDSTAPKTKIANESDYTVWSKEEELAWFKERFPEIAIEVLENINRTFGFGKELWGVFHNASVYIQENAQKGTTYHEAFHVVFNMYLTDQQRKDLLEGGTEEEIADRFMDWKNGTIGEKTLGTKIARIFKQLWEWIQFVATGKISENIVFRRIENNYYKSQPFTKDISKFKSSQFTKFKAAPGWSLREQVLMARGINHFILTKGLNAVRNSKKYAQYKDLDDIELINKLGSDKVSGLFMLYKEVYKALKKIEPKFKDNFKFESMLKSFEEDIKSGKPITGGFIATSIRDLTNYGINISSENKETEDDDMQASSDEIGHQETWQVSQSGVNSKNLISYNVKKYIRGLAQMTRSMQSIKDPLGIFDAPVNYDTFYDTIMKDVSGETSIKDMISILEELSIYHPEYNKIAADLKSNKQLSTEFFAAFSKPELLQIFVNEELKGEGQSHFILSYSNRAGIKGELTSRWATGVESTGYIGNKDKTSKVAEKLNTLKADISESNIEDISRKFAEITADVGIYIPSELLLNLFNPKSNTKINNIISNVISLVNKIGEGNPFEGETKENNLLNNLLNVVSKGVLSLTQPSFNNSHNEKVYAHLEGNYMMRFIHQLKKDNNSMKATLESLMKDEFYRQALPLFREVIENASEGKVKLLRDSLEYAILDGTKYKNEINGSMFSEMSPDKLNVTLLSLFANNGSKSEGWFRLFTLSDAPIMPIVKYVRKTIENDEQTERKGILDSLVEVARAEVLRIKRIQSRQNLDDSLKFSDDKGTLSYDNPANASFDTGFKLLPFLNKKGLEEMNLEDSNSPDWDTVKKLIKDYLDNETKLYKNDLIDQKIISLDDKGNVVPMKGKFPGQFRSVNSNINEFIREFVYNDYFMRTQFTLVSMGDMAFYTGKATNPTINGQKRAKEIHSPRTLLDLTAVNPITKEPIMQKYRGVILKDEKFPSSYADSIFNALMLSGSSLDEATRIAARYGYSNDVLDGKPIARVDNKTFYQSDTINQTDAQAYITLPFFRDTMIGAGRWNQKLENSYNRLVKKEGTQQDILEVMEVFQPFKPFAYGIIQEEHNGEIINIPTQHKNSEYILIPQLVEKGDEKIKKLYARMTDKNNPIQIANFQSAGKVGNYGVVAAEDINKDTIVHEYDMTHRGIQQEVPEHFLDTQNLFGTQIRALIMSNLVLGKDYTIGKDSSMQPKSLEAKQLYDLYNKIIVSNIEKASEKLAEDFGINETDPRTRMYKIRDLLLDEIRSRNKGEQYEKAIEVRQKADGSWGFALPLFHPLHSKIVENLINSVFKNRITKQKINGGAFVQVSSFGFTNDLQIQYREDGGVDYVPVKLPIWNKRLFEPYMENGEVNMEKLTREAPDLLRGVGYRIPTEDKYSMIPLKVVGFLPLEAGGAVMLPAEITTIAGSDFDIDKMFIMMPEGGVNQGTSFEELLKNEIEFTERDLQKAEDIMNKCKGITKKSGKFGR